MALRWRIGRSHGRHFGGVVERVLGTLMDMVHQLPGTTFSNIHTRGTYDAEGMAVLTLAELETWLALAIAGKYHQEIHATLRQVPLQRFTTGLTTPPPPISDPKAFLVDFLPLLRRRIQRRGFVIDHIAYFSNALRPWIAARQTTPPFLIPSQPAGPESDLGLGAWGTFLYRSALSDHAAPGDYAVGTPPSYGPAESPRALNV